ncbi:response regulator transcription factor [Duganella dendranthematis]|jgi:two-component system NarL family response regulator|uniref:Response regulator transcription factor n=1 Tax=Duganella dendranthematis TaxID=2728021 RepID=A0ABX6MH62_9BURK|nr:response regulator transcription factor [Duganella dendranthematis]QJD93674.1 response regulator transcription factor [Duganella dendranthematis]
MDPISILIADDHPLILAGLASLLATMPEFRVVAQATDGLEAVALYRQHRPDVVIMDLSMPRLNGVEAIEQIRAEDSSASIVILTTYQGDEDVFRGLRAGAKAYLLKDGDSRQLVDCLRAVASGQQFLPAEVASKLAERKATSQLSRRELDILAHLATGKSNKMIARSADIEVGTVKFHVNNILAKLNVASRTEAATVAARRGLLSVF